MKTYTTSKDGSMTYTAPTEQDKKEQMLNWLVNPVGLFPRDIIYQFTVKDFENVLLAFKLNVKDRVKAFVPNPSFKDEVNKTNELAYVDVVQGEFTNSVAKLLEQLKVTQKELRSAIQLAKYPKQFATLYDSGSFKSVPNSVLVAIGSTEYQTAMTMDIENVSDAITQLKSASEAKRYDFCSALVERLALVRLHGEMNPVEVQEFSQFVLSYFEILGIQEMRRKLRYVNAFVKYAETQLTTTLMTSQANWLLPSMMNQELEKQDAAQKSGADTFID